MEEDHRDKTERREPLEILDLRGPQDLLEIQANEVILEHLDNQEVPVSLDKQETLVFLDLLVPLVSQGRPVLQVLRDPWVQQVCLARQDLQVHWARWGQVDRLDLQALLDHRVSQVLRAHQVPKVILEILALLGLMVLMEVLGHLVLLDPVDLLDHGEILAVREIQDKVDPSAHQAPMVTQGNRDPQDPKDLQD